MQEVRSYLTLAQSTSVAEFVSRSDAVFLVKRPRKRPIAVPAPTAIAYATQLTKVEIDPFADEWQIFPVKKREGNPYPDRISVGRATNCDIVIRLPSISKVHAHILKEAEGSYKLSDNEAANATFVNGRKVLGKKAMPMRVRDTVAFGTFELEFVDAERLYQILRTEVTAKKTTSAK